MRTNIGCIWRSSRGLEAPTGKARARGGRLGTLAVGSATSSGADGNDPSFWESHWGDPTSDLAPMLPTLESTTAKLAPPSLPNEHASLVNKR